MAGTYERGSEPSGFINAAFLDWLRNCYLVVSQGRLCPRDCLRDATDGDSSRVASDTV